MKIITPLFVTVFAQAVSWRLQTFERLQLTERCRSMAVNAAEIKGGGAWMCPQPVLGAGPDYQAKTRLPARQSRHHRRLEHTLGEFASEVHQLIFHIICTHSIAVRTTMPALISCARAGKTRAGFMLRLMNDIWL